MRLVSSDVDRYLPFLACCVGALENLVGSAVQGMHGEYVARRLDRGLSHYREADHVVHLLEVFDQLVRAGRGHNHLDLGMHYYLSLGGDPRLIWPLLELYETTRGLTVRNNLASSSPLQLPCLRRAKQAMSIVH